MRETKGGRLMATGSEWETGGVRLSTRDCTIEPTDERRIRTGWLSNERRSLSVCAYTRFCCDGGIEAMP